jgi:hypothetical protein
LKRISEIDIQYISKLYVLLDRETSNLIYAINYIDFLKKQLAKYAIDMDNSFTNSYSDTKQILSIYYKAWEVNKDFPNPISVVEIVQAEDILKQHGYDKNMISKIQMFRQNIENRNEAIIKTYEGVRSNIVETNQLLATEIGALKKLIENK